MSDILRPRNCSTPGFPVLCYLQEFSQTHAHWFSDAIQPTISSCVVSFSSCPQSFPASGSFLMSRLFASWSFTLVLPMNIQGWFPLGLTGLISLKSKGLLRVFSRKTVRKHQFFGCHLLYGPTLTSVHDCRKKHSFDYTDLCWQSVFCHFLAVWFWMITLKVPGSQFSRLKEGETVIRGPTELLRKFNN